MSQHPQRYDVAVPDGSAVLHRRAETPRFDSRKRLRQQHELADILRRVHAPHRVHRAIRVHHDGDGQGIETNTGRSRPQDAEQLGKDHRGRPDIDVLLAIDRGRAGWCRQNAADGAGPGGCAIARWWGRPVDRQGDVIVAPADAIDAATGRERRRFRNGPTRRTCARQRLARRYPRI